MNKKSQGVLLFFYRFLLILILVLLLILAGGTIYGILLNKSRPAAQTQEISQEESISVGEEIFTGIGRLRVLTNDEPASTLIISISFPYIPQDRPFTEELMGKIPDFRRIVSEYFGAFSAEEIQSIDEWLIKAEILRRYNQILFLGAIEILYFDDFMLIN